MICDLCRNEEEKFFILDCEHIYCLDCLRYSLMKNPNFSNCDFCRTVIDFDNIKFKGVIEDLIRESVCCKFCKDPVVESEYESHLEECKEAFFCTVCSKYYSREKIEKHVMKKHINFPVLINPSLLDSKNIQISPLEFFDKSYYAKTISDGSCMIHAILLAIDPFYIQLSEDSKIYYVKYLRKKLADNLIELNPRTGKSYYDSYSWAEYAKADIKGENFRGQIFEYTLEGLKNLFESARFFLGDEIVVYLNDLLNINLWFITLEKNDFKIFFGHNETKSVHNILLLHSFIHYETIVRVDGENIQAVFSHQDLIDLGLIHV